MRVNIDLLYGKNCSLFCDFLATCNFYMISTSVLLLISAIFVVGILMKVCVFSTFIVRFLISLNCMMMTSSLIFFRSIFSLSTSLF